MVEFDPAFHVPLDLPVTHDRDLLLDLNILGFDQVREPFVVAAFLDFEIHLVLQQFGQDLALFLEFVFCEPTHQRSDVHFYLVPHGLSLRFLGMVCIYASQYGVFVHCPG